MGNQTQEVKDIEAEEANPERHAAVG